MNRGDIVAVFCDALHEQEMAARLTQLANFPFRIFPVRNGPSMYRAVRTFCASRNCYRCALNLCTGTTEDEDRASQAVLASLFEQLEVVYCGCRYMTLKQPLDVLFMMCVYAGLPMPLFSVVKSEEDIEQLSLRFPVKLRTVSPLQCVFGSVVTDMPTLRRVLNEVLQSHDKVLVWEVNGTKSRELVTLVSASGCVAIAQEGSKDAVWLQQCTPSIEKYSSFFATTVMNNSGFSKLCFNKSPYSDQLFLEDVELGCSLVDLNTELLLAFSDKRLLEECVRCGEQSFKRPVAEVRYGGNERGYFVCANKDVKRGEVVFEDEGRSFAIVTRPFVDKHWGEEEKVTFAEYAWPLDTDGHVYAIWESNPSEWRPINHSCDPNCIFGEGHSLNVIAARDIKKEEEITMDYSTFCDYTMRPFSCSCRSECCRGIILPDEAALRKYGTHTWHRRPPIPPAKSV
ncbi:hypothetical protein TCSYLVIO_009938 [Trypanosoma cruzi]|nr:hypothetical protein TCSYLVIO_009938 [Trypanosoma cruzi]